MARPCKNRCVCKKFREYSMVPKGREAKGKPVRLAADELESLMLADYECIYHEKAAKKMKISRQTFGRILESARKKTADAVLHGKELIVSCCGPVEFSGKSRPK